MKINWMFPCIVMVMVSFSGMTDTVKVTGEIWPPFEFVDKTGKTVGIDVDIANIIFKRIGHTPVYELKKWDDAWNDVTEGNVDAVFSTSRKSSREEFLYYPVDDMWVSEYVFYTRKDKKKKSFKGYADAKKLKTVVVKGNSYTKEFFDAKLDMIEVDTLEEALKMIAEGKADIYPIDKIIGAYTCKELGLQNVLTYYDFVIFSKGYPMPFAKKSTNPKIKKIFEAFSAELKKMKESGEYSEIISNWMSILQE